MPRRRKALAVAAAGAASAAGAVFLRRRATRSRDRAELYFADGSLVTLTQGSAEADRLLAHARELLAASRR
jgi:hypothetical protein